ncbi:hypothetical protein RchiOBHm_Chr2g0119631 [Rosa chinensis]|uniref:Uncharacterized protein n=1 Tax=Rosa chinensis TaxID=74649 RepID=A0A2P6RS24_ROSCH|nr:hypothetical protein RchiOBHm_Chr2g0119631 [Rosa chinensis]
MLVVLSLIFGYGVYLVRSVMQHLAFLLLCGLGKNIVLFLSLLRIAWNARSFLFELFRMSFFDSRAQHFYCRPCKY